MLYSSNTARKDSPILQNNKPLRTHHRQIMNCLSQLVMCAKSASSIWPPPDANHRLIVSANETFIAVQQFISVATHSHVLLSQVTMNDSSMPTIEEEGQTNVMSTLENYIVSVSQLVVSFIDSVRSGQYSSPALIVQVRSMVTDVAQFLSLVDDISIEENGEERSDEFKNHRMAVYNSVSDLVTATQTVTGALAPSDASEQLISAAQLIETSMKDLLVATKFLIEERESREHVALQMYIDKYRDKRRNSQESRRRLSLDIQPPKLDGSKIPSPTSPESDGFEKLPSPSRSKVFQKFFGQLPSETTLVDEAPYLQHDYGPEDMVLTLHGTVKGGTLRALVERLTLHDHYGNLFFEFM
jgi:son of sevenless-like protein